MFGELRRLGTETVIYGFSTVVARFLNFLLLPLYTHQLSPAEYGVVGALYSYIAFGNILFVRGLDFAYMRHAKEGEEPFSTAFISLLGTALPLALLLHLAAGALGRLAGVPADLIRYSAWILALDALSAIPFAELRLAHRAWAYAGIKTAGIVLTLALNYVFLVRLGLGVRGVFLATLVASSATLAMLAPVFMTRMTAAFNGVTHAQLLRFAWPLVPAGLGSMAVQVIDRPILFHMVGEEVTGVYQANYRLGIFMMMIVNMFDAAWRPFFLQRADKPEGPALFARVCTYFTAGALFVFLGVTVFAADIAALLMTPDYYPGIHVVPLVTLGYLFNGLYVNFLAPVTIAKRTGLVAWATAAGAAANIAANLLLIPRLGMMGAAWATLLAYVVMAGLMWASGRKLYAVPYEWRRLLHASCAAAACLFLPKWWALPAYPVLLLATGFLSRELRSER
jgi:O-antigen/teichoic acid export membrane protein